MAEVEQGDKIPEGYNPKEVNRVREIVANVYSFVRSKEYTRAISSYTFDHYLEEAKRLINGAGRTTRDSEGNVFSIRPTQLESLSNLETDFNSILAAIREMAKKADKKEAEENPTGT